MCDQGETSLEMHTSSSSAKGRQGRFHHVCRDFLLIDLVNSWSIELAEADAQLAAKRNKKREEKGRFYPRLVCVYVASLKATRMGRGICTSLSDEKLVNQLVNYMVINLILHASGTGEETHMCRHTRVNFNIIVVDSAILIFRNCVFHSFCIKDFNLLACWACMCLRSGYSTTLDTYVYMVMGSWIYLTNWL